MKGRSSGLLLPIFSLPGDHGVGTLGKGARRFIDFLAEGRQHVWQILPLVPPGSGDSPYMSPSAFAGNPLFLDLDDLADHGLLTRQELETDVEDGAVCREILRAIGYAPVVPEVVKDRLMLQKDSMTACLDSVHGLGDFLELEILVAGEKERPDALYRIEKLLNYLGYQVSDTVRTSYLSMLQKK